MQSPTPYVKVKSKKQRSRSNIINQEDKTERNSFVDGIMVRKPNSSQVFSVPPQKELNSGNEIEGSQSKLKSDRSRFFNELVNTSNIALPSVKAEDQVKSEEFVKEKSKDLVDEFNIDLRADDFPALPSNGNKIKEAQLEISSQKRSEEWFRPWVQAVTQSIPCSDNEKLKQDQAVMTEIIKPIPEHVNMSQNLIGGNIETGETLYEIETETIDAHELSSYSSSMSISCSMENNEVPNASEISSSSSFHETAPSIQEDSRLLIPPAHFKTPVQFVREKPEDYKGAGEIIFGFEPNPVLLENCHSPALMPLLPAHCWPSRHYIPLIPVPNLLLSAQLPPELPHQLSPQLARYPEPPPLPEVSPSLARLPPTPWHSTLDTRSVHSYDSAEPEQEEQDDQPTSDSGMASSPSRKSSSGSSVTESACGPANSTSDIFNLGEIVSFVQGNWSSFAQDDSVEVFTVDGQVTPANAAMADSSYKLTERDKDKVQQVIGEYETKLREK